MRSLKRLLVRGLNAVTLVFRSKRQGPLLETTILNQGLYPALEALALLQGDLHGFRRGCNRRTELAGINSAVIRQHLLASSTALRTASSFYSRREGKKSTAAANYFYFNSASRLARKRRSDVAAGLCSQVLSSFQPVSLRPLGQSAQRCCECKLRSWGERRNETVCFGFLGSRYASKSRPYAS